MLILSAAGCATPEGDGRIGSGGFGQQTSSLPATPAEQRLDEDRRVFNRTILGGAATGAWKGALFGALLGLSTGDADNIWKGAVAGGAFGGVAGAIDGYRVAKRREAARRRIREIDLITQEVEAENRRIEQSIANVDMVIADTRRSLREARAGYRNRAVSLDEVRARERRAARNVGQIDELIENMQERNEQYEEIAGTLRAEGKDTSRIDRKIAETRALLAQRQRERDLLEQELVQGRIG